MKVCLRTKIIISIVLLISTVGWVFSYFFISNQRDIIYASLKSQGLMLATNLAYNSGPYFFTEDTVRLDHLVQGILTQPDVRYVLIENAQGQVLAGKGWKEKHVVSEQFRQQSEVARLAQEPLTQLIELSAGQSYYDVTVPVFAGKTGPGTAERSLLDTPDASTTSPASHHTGQQKIGLVRVGLSLSRAAILMQKSLWQGLGILLLIGLVAIGYTLVIAVYALAPVQELLKTTKRIARGDLSGTVAIKRDDELGELAKAYNQMMENLKNTMVSIELLKQEQKRFRDVSESTGDWLWEIDAAGTFLYSNPVVEDVLGYTTHELMRMKFYDLYHPQEREKLKQQVFCFIRNKEKFFEFHSRHMKKNGEDVIIETNGVPVLDMYGQVTGYRGVNRDITRRKLSEDAVRRSEKILSLHVQRTPLAYIEWNLNFEVADWNPSAERIFGYAKEEALGRNAFDLIVPPHAQDRMRDVFRDLIQQRGGIRSTNGNIRKDGRSRICEWYNTPLQDSEGAMIGVASLIQDITEQKRVEEELRKEKFIAVQLSQEAMAATKAKSDFLANMSHEIRTPMNAILGFSEILQKTNLDDRQKKFLDTIQSSGQLLIGIINDILDFSKLEAGRITFESINFNLEYLIYDIFRMVVLRLKDRPFDTYIDIDSDVPRIVKGDPTRLRQVFINLLGNALKFTSQGEIGVIVRKDDQVACASNEVVLRFIVRDTGIGIAEDKLERIFESFTQADESMTRRYGGTGLGLTISRAIINAMGGKIWAESRINNGSEFIFILKMKMGQPISDSDIHPLHKSSLKNKKVFILDDNLIACRVLKKCCQRLSMDILSVEDSPYAALYRLEKLAKSGVYPDIIICDIMMAGIDGYEFVSRIRANKLLKDIKVLAISSDVRIGQSHEAQKKGFDGFISKPIVAEELLRVMETTLGDQRSDGDIVTRHLAEEYLCKGIRILVVEDSEANRDLMKAFFHGLGCIGDYAQDGQEAVEMLKDNAKKYDLCFMDVQMPVMGGLEATKIIRQSISKDLPIIALTAAALKDDEEKCLAVGMNGYLTKPINMMQLRDKIIECIRK
jgi:two-component system sensor histidine kinase/response regulator